MISAIYFFVSLTFIFLAYLLSVYFSGDNFRWKWCCLLFLLNASVNFFHMSVIEYGYITVLPALEPILEGNGVVKLLAWVSMFLQASCLPRPYDFKRWMLRKKIVKVRARTDYIRRF